MLRKHAHSAESVCIQFSSQLPGDNATQAAVQVATMLSSHHSG
jgi:hypothetical protein